MTSARLDLLVVADSFGGGLGAAAQQHARWFARHDWAVLLAAPAADAAQVHPARALSLSVPDSAFHAVEVTRAARSLRALLRRERPSVVHAHGTRSQLLAVLAGRRPVVTMHGAGRVEGQGWMGSRARDVARRIAPLLADAAYSASPAGRGWTTMLHASPLLADLDVSHLARTTPHDEPPLMLWVGRLDAPKRPDLFVRAVARAAQVRPLRAALVGGGPMLEEVRSLVCETGAPAEVVGEVADVRPWLQAARAVFLFSHFEGVPFAVQEAMWAGRPVVLSPLPSLRWFAGEAAIYADDVAGAAAAMAALCDDEVAVDRATRVALRVRELIRPDDPYPRLMSAYVPR